MKTRFLSSASIGPLTRKVTLILVLLVLLPSVLLSNYIYQTLAQSYMSRVINERQQMLNQTTSQIDAMFRSMQNKCRYIAENNVVVSFLRKGNLVDYPIYTKHHIEDTISLLRYTFEYQIVSYRDICIFSDTPSLPENSVLHPEKKLSALDFWDRQEFDAGKIHLLFLSNEQTAQYYHAKDGSAPLIRNIALIVYDIFDYYSARSLGKLVLEVQSENLFHGIVDPSSQCFLTDDGKKAFGTFPSSMDPVQLSASKETYVLSSGRYYSFLRSEPYHYLLLDTQGVSSQDINKASLRHLFISLLVPLILIVTFLMLIRYFFSRINQSITTMDKIVENHFQGRIPDVRNDELGQIDQRYNLMLDKISSQEQELLEEANNRKSAQFEALRQQLNPHFIYNTLNLFSGSAYQSGDYALGDSIAFFGRLLHYNLQDDQMFTLLGNELQNVQSLVQIFALDPEKKISVVSEIPDEIQQLSVMKFLLQPLVENSISHGLKHNQMLEIHIQAAIADNRLWIDFRDNGSGISPERLSQIQDVLSHKTTADVSATPGHLFIGLTNLKERLHLYYGDQAGFDLSSVPDEYTRIRISLPVDHERMNQLSR